MLVCMYADTGFAQTTAARPVLWRQIAPASATTQQVFLNRSPQFTLFTDGLIVFRDDTSQTPYRQIRLSQSEVSALLVRWAGEFGLPGLTTNRLKRETPYIESVQKELKNDPSKVSIWIGIHNPPSLHTYPLALLEARSGNTKLGPGWDALYRLQRYLSTFTDPRAEPFVPERIEISVQELPPHLSGSAALAKEWPIPGVRLPDVKGTRKQGFRTLTGETARQAYTLLRQTEVVKSGNGVYLVWARPLLLP